MLEKVRESPGLLHTKQDGQVVCLGGSGVTGYASAEEAAEKLKAGEYRVVGCPENYGLITSMYAAAVSGLSSFAVFVGSRQLAAGDDPLPEKLAVLRPYELQHGMWHILDDVTFRGYQLLDSLQHDEDPYEQRSAYLQHPATPYADFLGLRDASLVSALLEEIVDPRWFLRGGRHLRLRRLESYFGLKKPQQAVIGRGAFRGDRPPVYLARFRKLAAAAESLPRNGVIAKEAEAEGVPAAEWAEWSAKQLLNFIARNWLVRLGCQAAFAAERFFRCGENREAFEVRFAGKP